MGSDFHFLCVSFIPPSVLSSRNLANKDAGVPHATTEEIHFRNYIIPRNTILIPNTAALSRSPERYSHPDVFDPTRFLGDTADGAASARSADFGDRDHFNFGFGNRFCPGSYVAEGSLYIALVRVMWGFEIGIVGGAGGLLDMEDQQRE